MNVVIRDCRVIPCENHDWPDCPNCGAFAMGEAAELNRMSFDELNALVARATMPARVARREPWRCRWRRWCRMFRRDA